MVRTMKSRNLARPADESGFFGGRELRSASSMTELSLEQQLCIPARQRAQLSPPPASSFDSKKVALPSSHGSRFRPKGFVTGVRPSRDQRTLCREERSMKSQNVKTNPQNTPSIIFRPDVPEEQVQNGPTLAEIRQRAFEIHTERGGIHGCDLDDWRQAERELREKYNKMNDGRQKKK
jgi:hypothetical protein